MQKILHGRFRFIFIISLFFIIVSAVSRSALLVKSFDMLELSALQFFKIYSIGFFYDVVTLSYVVIPFVVYVLFMPSKIFQHKFHRYMTYSFMYVVLYLLVLYVFSEWFFWDEFGVRFNFIAVDYLVYTTEVIGNIKESYPIGALLSSIAVLAAMLLMLILKYSLIQEVFKDKSSFKKRVFPAFSFLLLPFLSFLFITQSYSKISNNQYHNELAKSGLYSLFNAFRNNTLDYDTFYLVNDDKKVLTTLRKTIKSENSLDKGILHHIKKEGEEKNYNVMMIVVESLSGEFLESLNGYKGLTPRLDELAKKSMFFNNFYATGTRTVRGMESLVLSIPPTAGRSIVKRPDNKNMFSSGFIFKNKGYSTKFIYGGHGYFDNMNSFFSNNGFDVVDRTDFSEDEDTFHTIWGVCDENLMDKALSEADASYKEHKPFMSFVMTTSNHRPYNYPEGRIDIPSHSGRKGAVKYTDFSIGKFLEDAKKKPWFKDTIFVVVADHCASSAGKTHLPINKYKIPLFIYAPDIIKAQVISKVSSQIDVLPTIFSLLNWSYDSKFYGQDILEKGFEERALIGTYQLLGLYKNSELTLLSPGKNIKSYHVDAIDKIFFQPKYTKIETTSKRKDEIIAYYQGASILHKKALDRF